MKILVCALMLSCFVASTAAAEDSQQMIRDRLVLCSQFEIRDLDALLILDSSRYCCGIGTRFRACHDHEWDEPQG
jgi:hypothetical protein